MNNPFHPGGARSNGGPPPEIPDHALLRRIGSGSYGEVWLARSVLGAFRAVKIVHRGSFEHERPYEREFSGIQRFEPVSRTHEGLVDILQVGRNDAEGYFYYVMELADDEFTGQNIQPNSYDPLTLSQTVTARRRLPFDECVRVGLSLVAAVGHLHRHGLIHRDIKPSNIIFVNGTPKLADIGLVTTVGSSSIPGGTLGYLAPEGLPSPQADIYSLGKVLYEISTGKDRQEFPELPTEWEEVKEPEKLAELNEVIIRACEPSPAHRYQSVAEMEADLVLLQSGKSVKRLRALERRVALLTRAALAVALLAVVVGLGYYQLLRSRREATERLASAYIKAGAEKIQDGDYFDALIGFTEALNLHLGDRRREQNDRVRLATTLRRCPRLLHMWFSDHRINDIQFSPDGRRVASAGGGGEVFVWGIGKSSPSVRLQGHAADKEVESVGFDKTGQLLVTAALDRTARVWDAVTGQQRVRLDHPGKVYAAEFSPDGRRILTAGGDRVARIWDWQTGMVLTMFTNHAKAIRHASFSPDGKLVVTASEDRTARLWNPETGAEVVPPLLHGTTSDHWVYYASFSPDGTRLATGCFDNLARLWDVKTGEPKGKIEHDACVGTIEFSPDGRYLLVGCLDFTTRLWDAATGKAAGPPLKNSSIVNSARFSPDGSQILTADTQGIISLWGLPPINWRPKPLLASFSADGRRYAVAGQDRVELRDAANDHLLHLIAPAPAVQTTLLGADGARLLILSTNADPRGPVAQIWNVGSTQSLSSSFPCGVETPAKGSRAKKVLLSHDATRLVAANEERAQVWDTATGRPVGPVLVLPTSISKPFFNPDGSTLGISAGRWVHMFEVGAGSNHLVLKHAADVEHAEFSPDGRRIVTACTDGGTGASLYAQVWDATTGQPIGPRLTHNDGVIWASFSPDGRRVVTASEDRTVRVWDAATGERLTAQLRHGHEAWFAGFSPDGRWLLSTSRDGTARVWDSETGDPIIPPLLHVDSPSSAQFIAGGRRIATRKQIGRAWIWDLPADDRSATDLVQMIQLLSQYRSERIDDTFPLDKATLQKHWNTLSAKYPADFTLPADEILSWHEREAEDAESAGQWSAAGFHLDRIIASRPGDTTLQQRRSALATKDQASRNGAF